MRVSGLVESEKYRMRHRRHVRSRRHVEDIEHEEIANGMAFRKEAHKVKLRLTSFYRQLIRSITTHFVLSPTVSF